MNVGIGVAVAVGVGVFVGTGVFVGVGVDVAVGVGVGVLFCGTQQIFPASLHASPLVVPPDVVHASLLIQVLGC